jgi:hypothetical protein
MFLKQILPYIHNLAIIKKVESASSSFEGNSVVGPGEGLGLLFRP